jgi:hypothetical protein
LKSDNQTLPANHVSPDLRAFLTGPMSPYFWGELKNTVDWAEYVWTGPKPQVRLHFGQVYPGQQFSSQAIYKDISDAVWKLKLPDTVCHPRIIHEGGPFTPYRTYLQIRREFSEFLVCAAPVGNSFFVTARKIDHFRHVKWWHYLIALNTFAGFLIGSIMNFGALGGSICVALMVSFIWSVFRYAAQTSFHWLNNQLAEIPVLGSLYLRWFRPDTYFRQDLHSAFMNLVDGVIREVVAGLAPQPPMRPETSTHGGPILKTPA